MDCNLKLVIYKLISVKDILSISSEITLRRMSRDISGDWSTSVAVRQQAITWSNFD